jgi:DNA-binding transcriptional LysR family regulator
VRTGDTPALFRDLRDRKIDLVISRIFRSADDTDMKADRLFDEHLFVVAGSRSKWARRRKVALNELIEEAWAMPELDNAVGSDPRFVSPSRPCAAQDTSGFQFDDGTDRAGEQGAFAYDAAWLDVALFFAARNSEGATRQTSAANTAG